MLSAAKRATPTVCAGAIFAAVLTASGVARADFAVHYDPVAAKISIIDNATGAEVITPDPAVAHLVFTPSNGAADLLEPTVQWIPHGDAAHADGLDLIFTFDNSASDTPTRAGPVFVPGIVFGLAAPDLGRVRTRDFHIAGKAYDMTTDPLDSGWNTAQEMVYPGDIYSPLAYLHAGEYEVGVSVLYPIVDPACGLGEDCFSQYAHRIGLGIHLPNPQGGRRAWEVRIPLSSHDFGDGDPASVEGFVPAHQVRQYTVCVRVQRTGVPVVPPNLGDEPPENLSPANVAPQAWLDLFAPYKDYFQTRYLGVQYALDPRPVLGCTTALREIVSPTNPYGFCEAPGGGGRPYPEGWGFWHDHLRGMKSLGWQRIMLWTPSGVFPQEQPVDYNFPFQFTSQWAHEVVPGGEPTLLRDITDGNGAGLGLWWGNSVLAMTAWPTTDADPPTWLNPWYLPHRDMAYHEVSGAVTIANATTIGLDAFTLLEPWLAHRWLRQMQAWFPGVRFVQESQPCDIMATLSPGYLTATRSNADAFYRVITPQYLAEFLLPGHELWAQIDPNALDEEIGHTAGDDDFVAKAGQLAAWGYVPLIFADISLEGLDLSASPASAVVPCDLLSPRIVAQSPTEVHVRSGESVVLFAQPTSPGACVLQWERALDWTYWTDVTDDGRFIGAHTPALSIAAARPTDATRYRLRVHLPGACADVLSDSIALVVCGSPDFDHDGAVATDADIEAFFACLAGSCCAACDTADFNADGAAATDADIEAFFRALAGAPC
jgi:hypothetical protein